MYVACTSRHGSKPMTSPCAGSMAQPSSFTPCSQVVSQVTPDATTRAFSAAQTSGVLQGAPILFWPGGVQVADANTAARPPVWCELGSTQIFCLVGIGSPLACTMLAARSGAETKTSNAPSPSLATRLMGIPP